MKSLLLCIGLSVGLLAAHVGALADSTAGDSFEGYPGDYRGPHEQIIGIDRFVMDDGQATLLYSQYDTGHVRRMYANGKSEFTIGPAFGIEQPAEATIIFVKDTHGTVIGLRMKTADGKESFCAKIPLGQQEVTFRNGDAILAGTLFVPPGPGPHPAIILLHGSGPLTRYSFGPYPHFFTSLGLAVLIYDKRGSGGSSGPFMTESSYYPNDFTNDAVAAFQFLQGRSEIDPKMIGLWGSSEGGMLTTQVAARNGPVAFVIDSSGFMMPLVEQLLYKVRAQLQAKGFSAHDVLEAEAYQKQKLQVERTGEGYEQSEELRERAKGKKWFFLFSDDPTSLGDMRWQWSHVYYFDPLPALKKVKCPVLGVFGAFDVYTDPHSAAANLRNTLISAGNHKVTTKIFPNANHALVEVTSGRGEEFDKSKGQAPGLFRLLAEWIRQQTGMRAPAIRMP
jgi:pimeloyl-ACP methyl ester carboxylesterase